MSGVSYVPNPGGFNSGPIYWVPPPPPKFDAESYLKANPDVEAEAVKNGLNPLEFAVTHYEKWGAAEGRPLAPAAPPTEPVSKRDILTTSGLGEASKIFLNLLDDLADLKQVDPNQADDMLPGLEFKFSGPRPPESVIEDKPIPVVKGPHGEDNWVVLDPKEFEHSGTTIIGGQELEDVSKQ